MVQINRQHFSIPSCTHKLINNFYWQVMISHCRWGLSHCQNGALECVSKMKCDMHSQVSKIQWRLHKQMGLPRFTCSSSLIVDGVQCVRWVRMRINKIKCVNLNVNCKTFMFHLNCSNWLTDMGCTTCNPDDFPLKHSNKRIYWFSFRRLRSELDRIEQFHKWYDLCYDLFLFPVGIAFRPLWIRLFICWTSSSQQIFFCSKIWTVSISKSYSLQFLNEKCILL